jgi:hypothetical protein
MQWCSEGVWINARQHPAEPCVHARLLLQASLLSDARRSINLQPDLSQMLNAEHYTMLLHVSSWLLDGLGLRDLIIIQIG